MVDGAPGAQVITYPHITQAEQAITNFLTAALKV
jgi:hypothetical protein